VTPAERAARVERFRADQSELADLKLRALRRWVDAFGPDERRIVHVLNAAGVHLSAASMAEDVARLADEYGWREAS
jgi:hypothetical protein